MMRSLFKRLKMTQPFTDFHHHARSWRNSKKMRRGSERKSIKKRLTDKELEEESK